MTKSFKKIKTKRKFKNLTDEQLLGKATVELIEAIKEFRDGKRTDFSNVGPCNNEVKRRGLSVGISENLIHRVYTGEFDHADGVAVGVSKMES